MLHTLLLLHVLNVSWWEKMTKTCTAAYQISLTWYINVDLDLLDTAHVRRTTPSRSYTLLDSTRGNMYPDTIKEHLGLDSPMRDKTRWEKRVRGTGADVIYISRPRTTHNDDRKSVRRKGTISGHNFRSGLSDFQTKLWKILILFDIKNKIYLTNSYYIYLNEFQLHPLTVCTVCSWARFGMLKKDKHEHFNKF